MKSLRNAIETLETRTLMSASIFPKAVTIDRLEVRADLFKFRADAAAGTAKLLSDLIPLKADHLAAATTVVPLMKQFRTDLKTTGQSLLLDRLNESAAALTDESVIVKEQIQIIKDRKNATAKAADEVVLTADRVKLQTDLIAGLTSRINTREAAEVTISNDIAAINTAASTDPNATTKLKADLSKLLSDRAAKMATLTTDLNALVADRTTLSADLSAG